MFAQFFAKKRSKSQEDRMQQAIDEGNVKALKEAVLDFIRENPSPPSAAFAGVPQMVGGAYRVSESTENQHVGLIFYNVGNQCARAEKYELAVTMYAEAIQAGASDPSVYNNMAASYKRLRDYKHAARAYSLAIDNYPDYAPAYARLAILIVTYKIPDEKSPMALFREFFSRGGTIKDLQAYVTNTPPEEAQALMSFLNDK